MLPFYKFFPVRHRLFDDTGNRGIVIVLGSHLPIHTEPFIAMPHKLKPIKPKRISDQVFDQLRELIFRGEFKAGEKILTERELAEAFGVSRTSVRDATNNPLQVFIMKNFYDFFEGQGK
jgi:hypothetical protein